MESQNQHDVIEGVAIIGMAGRFPGADDVDTFWKNLVEGRDCITFFTDDELSPLVSANERQHPDYVPARGILTGIDRFDADFFGISPLEATVMDPQQRLFLELCWEALENAGYRPDTFTGLVGVYGGTNNNTYFLNNVQSRKDVIEKAGAFQTMLANEKDFPATRVSYKLNLKGPSENIYTACSTGLVTVIRAFQDLMTYQCDLALAGGVSITVPQNTGYLYQEGGMLSPDGRCRPFDEQARGTTFNNGAGLVVLKRYEDALDDHDHIIAVIRGTGINNDGGDKVSFTAPSVSGQREAVAMALAQAEVPAESISYVETHGTATPMGDPIEIKALAEAFAIPAEKGKTCMLGSVKSNVGHLIHAAGVVGLIKTSLALHHKIIPATIHHTKPTRQIDWTNTPFTVCDKLTQWETESGVRRAGVSSFGVGGTNAHVILEEHVRGPESASSLPCHLVPLSARSENALQRQLDNFRKFAQKHTPDLADMAFTLQNGRKDFNHRCFGVFRSLDDFVEKSGSIQSSALHYSHISRRNPTTVFMFPGQGVQRPGMAEGMYRHCPVFREIFDKGAEILMPELDVDIRSLIFSQDQQNADRLEQTYLAQPAIFLVEYAMARTWEKLGIHPVGMVGHSIGELTAACLAGVFSFEDGLHIVTARGKLMQQCPRGAMLSVRASFDDISEQLPENLVVAVINAPQLCVVSGEQGDIKRFSGKLQRQDITCRVLRTSHAYHSPSMEQAAEGFVSTMQRFKLSSPAIPFISCVSGDWITDEQAISPEYWGQQIRSTVQYSKAISLLLNEEQIFLEVGPGTTASTLARQHLEGRKISVVSSLKRGEPDSRNDYAAFLSTCGKLWLEGCELNWPALYLDEQRGRIPLPTYPFEKKSFWLETTSEPIPVSDQQIHPKLQNQKNDGDDVTPNDTTDKERKTGVLIKLAGLILDSSGIEVDPDSPDYSFLEVGLDSLILTQLATIISNEFKISVSFRQLLDELDTPSLLADYILSQADPENLPAGTMGSDVMDGDQMSEIPAIGMELSSVPGIKTDLPQSGSIQDILRQQLLLMEQQLNIIAGRTTAEPLAGPDPRKESPVPARNSSTARQEKNKTTATACNEASRVKEKSFGPAAQINTGTDDNLSEDQQQFLQELIRRYTDKTKGSKDFARKNRQHLADPRTVSGFRPIFKEMIYPIVVEKSSGCFLWDVDGNEYVDMLNGFGSNFLGYLPEFVSAAIMDQMQRGIEIGPQHPLTADVATLMAKFTSLDRFAFCNTGSEAVLGCMRIARTVTGRKTIVLFKGAYHGIFDEVIVRGTPSLKSFAAAPGINNEAVANTLVLEYGDEKSLKIIRERSREIAAVLVEPVQSRNPALQPKRFLHELRAITKESGAALIIDEVITGFRIHPRGAQGFFDIQADLATYGKVIGGGLPIGIIGGGKQFMDALDGGQWQYGDDSFPEVGVTYFAGTFVRHPMALAACKSVLQYLHEQGGELQKNVNRQADKFCRALNAIFIHRNAPVRVDHFGSLMKVQFDIESPMNELLYFLLREKGVHIWDARPIFLTTTHTEQILEKVLKTFAESIDQLQAVGFMIGDDKTDDENDAMTRPPVPGARLGRTEDGTPAWFVADPHRPGKYCQVLQNEDTSC